MKLSDVCYKITDGSHNPPKGIDHSDFLMLSSKNISDDCITLIEPRYLTKNDFYNENTRTEVSADDLLMTIVGTIGRVAVVPRNFPAICLQRSVAVLKIDKCKASPRYMMYQLQSMRNFFETEAHGVAQRGLYLRQLENVTIQCPSIMEQRKIADNLDKVSHTIDLCSAILEKLDLLVKSRFVEMFGDVLTNSHKLPIEKMCERYYLKAGITTSADDIHIRSDKYTIPCYGGNGIRGYVDYVSYDGQYPIIGRQGALCGNVQLAIGKFHATEHAVLVKMLKKDNVVWVYYMLQMMNLNQYHTGAAQPGLAVKNLNTLNVIVVPYNHQKQFADFVEQTEKSKATIKQVKEKAETLKEKLMQDYFG